MALFLGQRRRTTLCEHDVEEGVAGRCPVTGLFHRVVTIPLVGAPLVTSVGSRADYTGEGREVRYQSYHSRHSSSMSTQELQHREAADADRCAMVYGGLYMRKKSVSQKKIESGTKVKTTTRWFNQPVRIPVGKSGRDAMKRIVKEHGTLTFSPTAHRHQHEPRQHEEYDSQNENDVERESYENVSRSSAAVTPTSAATPACDAVRRKIANKLQESKEALTLDEINGLEGAGCFFGCADFVTCCITGKRPDDDYRVFVFGDSEKSLSCKEEKMLCRWILVNGMGPDVSINHRTKAFLDLFRFFFYVSLVVMLSSGVGCYSAYKNRFSETDPWVFLLVALPTFAFWLLFSIGFGCALHQGRNFVTAATKLRIARGFQGWPKKQQPEKMLKPVGTKDESRKDDHDVEKNYGSCVEMGRDRDDLEHGSPTDDADDYLAAEKEEMFFLDDDVQQTIAKLDTRARFRGTPALLTDVVSFSQRRGKQMMKDDDFFKALAARLRFGEAGRNVEEQTRADGDKCCRNIDGCVYLCRLLLLSLILLGLSTFALALYDGTNLLAAEGGLLRSLPSSTGTSELLGAGA